MYIESQLEKLEGGNKKGIGKGKVITVEIDR